LTDEDLEAAKRLLLVLKQFEDKMEYCPSLPPLLCLLLQALTEAEAYAVVLALVERSLQPNTQPKLPHFQLTQRKEELFELGAVAVASAHWQLAVSTGIPPPTRQSFGFGLVLVLCVCVCVCLYD
jgi:hypothetical protein